MSIDEVRQEEAAARKRERNLERARAAAAKVRETTFAKNVREAASETKVKWPHCHCDFRGVRTRDDLLAMGSGCTVWICPRLDAVRRRVA